MLIVRTYIARNSYYEVPEHLHDQARQALDEGDLRAMDEVLDRCKVSVDDGPGSLITQSLVETHTEGAIPGALVPVSRVLIPRMNVYDGDY